jgi:hypothetical protein
MFIIDNAIQGIRLPIPGHEPEEYSGPIGDTLTIGSNSLQMRPQLAVNIAYVISAWAELEAYMWAAFAEFMGSDATTAMAIITDIESDGGRRAALGAIATSKLPADEAEGMMRFVETLRKRSKRRNKIAHGVWAIDSGIHDGIVLINQRLHLLRSAEQSSIREEITQFTFRFATSRSKAAQNALDEAHKRNVIANQLDFADWRIYRQRDFEKVSIIIDHLKIDLFDLTASISRRKLSERIAQLEKELHNDP